MKTLLVILLLFTGTAHGQLIKGSIATLQTLNIGGVSISGVKTVWDKDSLSKIHIVTPAMLTDAFKKNTTTLYKGRLLIGNGTKEAPLNVDEENLFYRPRADELRYWRPLEANWYWLNDKKVWGYYADGKIMTVVAVPLDAPAAVAKPDPVQALIERMKVLEAEVKKLKAQKSPTKSKALTKSARLEIRHGKDRNKQVTPMVRPLPSVIRVDDKNAKQ